MTDRFALADMLVMRTIHGSSLAAILLTACMPNARDVGVLDTDGASAGTEGEGTEGDPSAGEGPGAEGPADGGTTGDRADSEPVPNCGSDIDGDGVPLVADNAPKTYNPDQSDQDADAMADVQDLCPSVPESASSGAADTDDDGFGNACDPCRQTAFAQRIDGVPEYMQVRAIPSARDTDGDGIGDACDKCVRTPDCGVFGPDAPWRPSSGDPFEAADCQRDDDEDGIGDVCAGQALAGAAGPVGFGPDDDFDQDGLVNATDGCPRMPLPDAIACASDDACGPNQRCELPAGICDHVDTDGDDVGDECDTCPLAANPMQMLEGFAQEDDEDGDFVGIQCELGCAEIRNPNPIGFHAVSAGGLCCTTRWDDGRTILDPWGVPIDPACTEEAQAARECILPAPNALATPGLFTLPAGCDAALAAAGMQASDNVALTVDDVGSLDALWPFVCRLPPEDQDFDGLADACDFCTFAHDPLNLPYIDANGRLWEKDGKYCNGDWGC